MKNVNYIKLDSRNRISLTKIMKNLSQIYKVVVEGDKIVLEPIKEIPAKIHWLFEPGNKHLLEELKEGAKQKGTV